MKFHFLVALVHSIKFMPVFIRIANIIVEKSTIEQKYHGGTRTVVQSK